MFPSGHDLAFMLKNSPQLWLPAQALPKTAFGPPQLDSLSYTLKRGEDKGTQRWEEDTLQLVQGRTKGIWGAYCYKYDNKFKRLVEMKQPLYTVLQKGTRWLPRGFGAAQWIMIPCSSLMGQDLHPSNTAHFISLGQKPSPNQQSGA